MKEQDFHDFLDYQIMTDYLLTNTDRHMNNIAIVRNPDTLEVYGFAPIFDSGNSILERHIRIPELKKIYEKKMDHLRIFQKGKDIWK